MAMRLFVGNLSDRASESELREHFSAVGTLVFIHIPTDRETGRPRGIAFVEFSDASQAEEAIRRFHNQPFQGKPLIVNEARAREPGGGDRRNASAPRSLTSTAWTSEPGVTGTRPAHRDGERRNFGPDAAPRGQRKRANRRPESTRAPKGPMRERLSGQFFGGDEDDADSDTWNDENLNSSQE
jgi:cold-inducible RNA-binding protein